MKTEVLVQGCGRNQVEQVLAVTADEDGLRRAIYTVVTATSLCRSIEV